MFLGYNIDIRTSNQSIGGRLLEVYMIPDIITFLSLLVFVLWL